jgi:hypothetical protein
MALQYFAAGALPADSTRPLATSCALLSAGNKVFLLLRPQLFIKA